MMENEKIFLAALGDKIEQLISFSETLKTENATLKRDIIQRDETIKSLILSNEQLKKQYNSLTIARSISAPSNLDETNKAKARLTKLVQDVNKCITILKS